MKKYKPFLILLTMSMLSGASLGIAINSTGLFYEAVSTGLNISKGQIGFHATITMLVVAFLSLISSKLIDRFPFKGLIIFGSIVTALSIYLTAQANSLLTIYLLSILKGIGVTFIYVYPITLLISKWFKKSNGLATSIALMCSGLASAIAAPIITSSIENYSWRVGYEVQALMVLLFCLPAIFLPYKLDPHEENNLAYGEDEKINEIKENDQINKNYKMIIGYFYFSLSLAF